MKEKFAVTEYRKMQNRMNFAVCEEEETMFMDKTHGIGLVSQPGKVRALTADNRTKCSFFFHFFLFFFFLFLFFIF